MERKKVLKTLALVAAASVGGWLTVWLLGPVLLPFGVGYLFAWVAQPAVEALCRGKFPRWAAAGLTVTVFYALLFTAIYAVCWVLCREAAAFARQLPALAASLAEPAARVEAWLLERLSRFPDGLGQALREGVETFFKSGAGLAGRLYSWVFDLASAFLKRLPDLFLFFLTTVLSSFMLAAKLPELRQAWQKRAPEAWQRRLQAVIRRLRETLGGWVKAQVKLMGITFLVLTAGLLILGVDYPLLFGLLIAFIDALPVFGSGAVLLPWGLYQLLDGNTFLGVGLLCLYGAASLIRSALEPRMLGKQMGLDPLWTLLALYAGYRFFGILGMILFPVGAILAKQLWSHLDARPQNG
ncbi:MAG TPA: sporulation integral membrane protein YtvI [Candidatus Avoscillospira avicola]|uniref:Sporulation integral membrane protein YtvI n=1 Tax=Candidatus Avoscillospira avicola TaxID=2840706 RepID=A0A9D1DH52_9FIRM|nr:sporulation integral membrane protein YtvI [Candidatus Avoscillospira avicola]